MKKILSFDEYNISENVFSEIYKKNINPYFQGTQEEVVINLAKIAVYFFGATTIFWFIVNLIRKILKNNKDKVLNKQLLNKIGKVLPEVKAAILEIENMTYSERKHMNVSLRLMRKDPYLIFLLKELDNPKLSDDEINSLKNKLENRIMSNLTVDEKVIYRKLLNKKEFDYKRNRDDLKKMYK